MGHGSSRARVQFPHPDSMSEVFSAIRAFTLTNMGWGRFAGDRVVSSVRGVITWVETLISMKFDG